MREIGYYWIFVYGGWIIGFYVGDRSDYSWDTCHYNHPIPNSAVKEIDEKQIKRE